MPKSESIFIFVHEDYAAVIEAPNCDDAISKLAIQMSQNYGFSDNPSDYKTDIDSGAITAFGNGGRLKNVCFPV